LKFVTIKVAVFVSITHLAYNGPAIKGGCVARRSHPGTCPDALAEKLSRCKKGMARVFAVMAQILLRAGAIAVQGF